MKRLIVTLIVLGGIFAFSSSNVLADMSSANYDIIRDSLNMGGADGASGSYYMHDTMGQTAPGIGSSASYNLRAGYRQPGRDTPILSLIVEAQDDSTITSYTAFDEPGFEVTVASAAGYGINDYIVVVENEGGAQMVATGKITGIIGSDISVDKWSGDHASMSASPAGGDDRVYKLDGKAITLGTISISNLETGVAMIDVTTNAPFGYTCYLADDGNLRSGANDIDDVTDGTVTTSVEEYGVEKTGDNVQGAGSDVAITTTKTTIASTAGGVNTSRTMAIYKAAINTATVVGSYGHISSYYCTAEF